MYMFYLVLYGKGTNMQGVEKKHLYEKERENQG